MSSLQIEFLYTWNHVGIKTPITWNERWDNFFHFFLKEFIVRLPQGITVSVNSINGGCTDRACALSLVLKLNKQEHGTLCPRTLLIVFHEGFPGASSGSTHGVSEKKGLFSILGTISSILKMEKPYNLFIRKNLIIYYLFKMLECIWSFQSVRTPIYLLLTLG